jgi:DnaJ-class molecular chaperone
MALNLQCSACGVIFTTDDVDPDTQLMELICPHCQGNGPFVHKP